MLALVHSFPLRPYLLKPILHVFGLLQVLFSATFVLPIACALLFRDGTAMDFLLAALGSAASGAILAASTFKYRRELKKREGFLLVALVWIVLPLSAAVPLRLTLPDLSWTDAYFEAVSGLTTTGSTVLTGLDELAPSINLWRNTLHWFGGIGIIVLALAILPMLGVGGMQLYRAEVPGPLKEEKLTPRLKGTAKSVLIAYLIITAVGILALYAAGMSWFDAICHAFSVMGLGGFSNYDANVGHFNSPAIEVVLTVLMLVASLNFARHFVAIRRMSLTAYEDYPEGKALLMLLGSSSALIGALLWTEGVYSDFLTALRHATFSLVSVASTTGFVTEDYSKWPLFAPVWMIVLSCIACNAGSTGGGIKMFRLLVLQSQAARELKYLVHPNANFPLRVGAHVIPDRATDSVLAFAVAYLVTVLGIALLLMLSGLDAVSATSASIASVNNLGPGLGEVGPATNFQGLTDFQTWTCTAAMLLGRLEIFSILVLFSVTFWRK